MTIHSKLLLQRQQRMKARAQNSNAYDFFNILTGPELLSHVEETLPDHRERLFPPTETLSMFLAQAMSADRSCQRAVNDMAMKRLGKGMSVNSSATGGYCKARQRLPTEMVSRLTRTTGALIDRQIPVSWRWRGRRVRLIDGTTVSMPDTVENQARYPQQGGQQVGLGFPLCRVVGITCLSGGTLVDAAIGQYKGKGTSEHDLLRELLDNFAAGDVVVGDAFYGTYYLLTALQEKRVDVVFEQMGQRQRATDFRKGLRLGARDHLIKLPKPPRKPEWMSVSQFATLPEHLIIREVKVGHKVLITTVLSAKETPKHLLKQLYQQRWQIEVDLRHIKTTLGMETFSCKTPDMIEKEMWVYFLAYNLIRLLMAQAATVMNILPRQLSFKHTVQLWLSWLRLKSNASVESQTHILFKLIAQRKVGQRPGRVEPRAVKRRPKPLPLLMKPREQARADIKKHGHPKRLK